jgi:hypothetical protein
MAHRIINFALFQAGWFACVLGEVNNMRGIALVAAGVVIGVNLLFSKDRCGGLLLVLTVATIGFCVDTIQLYFGVIALTGAPRFPHLCPLLLVTLWALLATTLRSSMSWLAGRYALAAVLGAVAGPLSYLGGAKLGAVTMHPNRAFSIAALGVAWAVVMPTLVWLAHGSRLCAREARG